MESTSPLSSPTVEDSKVVILVTGGCGFIGSNFLNYAVQKYPEYKFINIDAMYYCAMHSNIDKVVQESDNYLFINGNIRDLSFIMYILSSHKVTHIIHFAAQSHVDNSFNNSLEYTLDNVYGTHVLIESVRRVNKKIIFLHFSTDEVYGESELDGKANDEQALLCPTNPYAATKAGAEMIVNSYHHSYDIPIIITRCNNVYGPNQYPEKLIPKFIKLLKDGKKCTIHGDGKQLRSFIHVNDVCSATDIILHRGMIGEIYNIGSSIEHEVTVKEITSTLIKKIKKVDDVNEWIEYVQDRPFNDRRYFITNDKLVALGWKQYVSLEEGINQLVN